MWCCNRRVSIMPQSSLFINNVTLILRRWSFNVNLAALLWIFSRMSMSFCVYRFRVLVLLTCCRLFLLTLGVAGWRVL